MLSHGRTFFDEDETCPDEAATDGRRDVLLWSLIAFALGMLSAWIGALAWISVQFLTL